MKKLNYKSYFLFFLILILNSVASYNASTIATRLTKNFFEYRPNLPKGLPLIGANTNNSQKLLKKGTHKKPQILDGTRSRTKYQNLIIILDSEAENSGLLNNAFFDTQNSDNISDKTLDYCLMSALNQDKAFILVSNNILNSLLLQGEVFNDFVSKKLYTLEKKYNKYRRFNNAIDRIIFKQLCSYIKEMYISVNESINNILFQVQDLSSNSTIQNELHLLKDLAKNNKFNMSSTPIQFKHYMFNENNKNYYQEIIIYFMCSYFLEIIKNNWITETIDNNLTILIPKNSVIKNSYGAQPTRYADTKTYNAAGTDQFVHRPNYDELFGIKISPNRSSHGKSNNARNKPKKIIESIKNIFLTVIDRKNSLYKKLSNFSWNIYLTGHGHPSKIYLNNIYKLKKIKEQYLYTLNSEEYEICNKFEHEKDNKLYYHHLLDCIKHKKYKDLLFKLKQINAHLYWLEEQLQKNTLQYEGMIASLSIEDFAKLLKFFNTQINTNLLVYSSCYSGGQHLYLPYKDLVLNYPIITTSLNYNLVYQIPPTFHLPPYQYIEESNSIHGICPDSIDVEKQQLKFIDHLNFSNFFSRINKNIFKLSSVYNIMLEISPYNLIEENRNKIINISGIRLPKDKIFIPLLPNLTFLKNRKNKLESNKINLKQDEQVLQHIAQLPELFHNNLEMFVSPNYNSNNSEKILNKFDTRNFCSDNKTTCFIFFLTNHIKNCINIRTTSDKIFFISTMAKPCCHIIKEIKAPGIDLYQILEGFKNNLTNETMFFYIKKLICKKTAQLSPLTQLIDSNSMILYDMIIYFNHIDLDTILTKQFFLDDYKINLDKIGISGVILTLNVNQVFHTFQANYPNNPNESWSFSKITDYTLKNELLKNCNELSSI